jgi:hypothetical protein
VANKVDPLAGVEILGARRQEFDEILTPEALSFVALSCGTFAPFLDRSLRQPA